MTNFILQQTTYLRFRLAFRQEDRHHVVVRWLPPLTPSEDWLLWQENHTAFTEENAQVPEVGMLENILPDDLVKN